MIELDKSAHAANTVIIFRMLLISFSILDLSLTRYSSGTPPEPGEYFLEASVGQVLAQRSVLVKPEESLRVSVQYDKENRTIRLE